MKVGRWLSLSFSLPGSQNTHDVLVILKMAVEGLGQKSDTVRVFLGLALLPDSIRLCTPVRLYSMSSLAQCLALGKVPNCLCARSVWNSRHGIVGEAGMELEGASQVVGSQPSSALSVSPSLCTDEVQTKREVGE